MEQGHAHDPQPAAGLERVLEGFGLGSRLSSAEKARVTPGPPPPAPHELAGLQWGEDAPRGAAASSPGQVREGLTSAH